MSILLTGDSSDAARTIGRELGVDESIGDLLPEQKVEKIRELLHAGRKVAMVGDGVNDAPALAEATVGIAMGQGTDVALETADVTLMTSDLSRLVEVLAISKRCYRVIMFNFWGTIGVDTVGIMFAFFGMLAPIIAALIHVGSELAFILNSARLFRQHARTFLTAGLVLLREAKSSLCRALICDGAGSLWRQQNNEWSSHSLAGRRGLCFRLCRWIDQHVPALSAQAVLRAD